MVGASLVAGDTVELAGTPQPDLAARECLRVWRGAHARVLGGRSHHPELRIALEQRRTTSREIVTQYLTRIAVYEDTLRAALAVNRSALAAPRNGIENGEPGACEGRRTGSRSRSRT